MREITLEKATLSDRYQLVIGNKILFLTKNELEALADLMAGVQRVNIETAISQTIADLRLHMASVTVKNPLIMIDEFEAGYDEYRRGRDAGEHA